MSRTYTHIDPFADFKPCFHPESRAAVRRAEIAASIEDLNAIEFSATIVWDDSDLVQSDNGATAVLFVIKGLTI